MRRQFDEAVQRDVLLEEFGASAGRPIAVYKTYKAAKAIWSIKGGRGMTAKMRFAAIAAATLLLSHSALAQDSFPNQPVRVIVPSAPGGLSDIFIRAISDSLQKKWGQPIVVEHRPGGNFNIGMRACAEAKPDGHTICIISSNGVTYNPYLYKNLGFDIERGIVPLTNLFFLTQALGVNAKLGAKALDDLIKVAKTQPGKLSYSTPAPPLIMFMNDLNKEHGLDLVRVPFRGGANAINGVLSMTTPIVFLGVGNMIPYLEDGSMVALLMDGAAERRMYPHVPTMAEYGYKRPITRSDFALYAPAGTPMEKLQKIADDVREIASKPDFQAKHFDRRGLEPVLNSPQEFAKYLSEQRAIAKQIVKEAGLEPQ